MLGSVRPGMRWLYGGETGLASLPNTRSCTSLLNSRCSIRLRTPGLLASGPFNTSKASRSFINVLSSGMQITFAQAGAGAKGRCSGEGSHVANKE